MMNLFSTVLDGMEGEEKGTLLGQVQCGGGGVLFLFTLSLLTFLALVMFAA